MKDNKKYKKQDLKQAKKNMMQNIFMEFEHQCLPLEMNAGKFSDSLGF